MIKVIFGTFIFDFLFFLFFGIIIYFIATGINALRNGKNKVLTTDNPFSYTARICFQKLGKYLTFIMKCFLVFFIVHFIYNAYGLFLDFIKNTINYEKVPLLALFFDIFKVILSYIAPFLVPAVVLVAIVVLFYGFFKTMYQYSARDAFKQDLLDVAGNVPAVVTEPAVVPANNNDKAFYRTDDSETVKIEYDKDENTEITEQRQVSEKKHKKHIPAGFFFNFCNNSLAGVFRIGKFLPYLFFILIISIGANALILDVKDIISVVQKQQRINELNLAVKNLSRAEAVAKITLLSETDTYDSPYPTKTYSIAVLDEDGEVIPDQTQIFSLVGNEICIDAMNINFDYSEIAKGEHYNIAYPYRIYSETMRPEDAIPFQCFNETSVSYPVMYALENKDVYSMDRNVYYQRLAELFEIARDENRSVAEGIRSFTGQVSHTPIYEGESYTLQVFGTGGIKVKKDEHLIVDDEELEFEENNQEGEDEKKPGFFTSVKNKITNFF